MTEKTANLTMSLPVARRILSQGTANPFYPEAKELVIASYPYAGGTVAMVKIGAFYKIGRYNALHGQWEFAWESDRTTSQHPTPIWGPHDVGDIIWSPSQPEPEEPVPADEPDVRRTNHADRIRHLRFHADKLNSMLAERRTSVSYRLAADLLEMHDNTSISLDHWLSARELVETLIGERIDENGV